MRRGKDLSLRYFVFNIRLKINRTLLNLNYLIKKIYFYRILELEYADIDIILTLLTSNSSSPLVS